MEKQIKRENYCYSNKLFNKNKQTHNFITLIKKPTEKSMFLFKGSLDTFCLRINS